MPVTLRPTRRGFLQAALGAAATARGAAPATRWALLSDTHVPADPALEARGFRPYDNLARVVPEIERWAPDGAIVSGDLARTEGLAGDYRSLDTLLRPLAAKLPVSLVLGNHDDRKNFLAAFSKSPGARQPVPNKCVTVIESAPVRILLLDSLLYTNRVAGLLGKAQRAWLEEYLARPNQPPTILVFHHPPTEEDSALLDSDRLLHIAARSRQVKAIVYGHSHAYNFQTQDGLHLVNVPAVGYNFTPGEPVGWVEATLTAEGADFRLRAFAGNREQDGKTLSLRWR
jgi:3',5'-cyclic AMP phosphodiesterase CpdA